MTDGSTVHTPFTDIPKKDRRVGPPLCRWGEINYSVFGFSGGQCGSPSTLDGDTLLLCTRHIRKIAELAGYMKPENARQMRRIRDRRETENLRNEVRFLNERIDAILAPPARTPGTDTDGTIYFARSGGYVKIGWTSDLGKRMKAYPPDTTLLATMPGTRKDERALHRKFAHLLTHGREWFPLAPQITEHIDKVVREHGEPPDVDFAAKPATRIVGPRLHNYVGGPRGNMAPTTVRG